MTDATYWSDTVGEARQSAPMVAVNHSRAQILAPHREVDPWAGLDRSAAAGGAIANEPATPAAAPAQARGDGLPEADRPPDALGRCRDPDPTGPGSAQADRARSDRRSP